MKKLFFGLLLVFLCVTKVCHAAPRPKIMTDVALQGVTAVTASFGQTALSVELTTHEVDIGKASDEPPAKNLTGCTYSHVPCSLVDYVAISVNGKALPVPRSIYADLADVRKAGFRKTTKGQFVLTLCGGDASESFTVKVTFDKRLVRQRLFVNNEFDEVMEKITYFEQKSEPMN
jgi:hypothetical protein